MTKILATIGPSSSTYSKLKKILSYTDILRLNGAHGNIKWHQKISKSIKEINRNARILIDLPGIKPRTLNTKRILIKKNERVFFYYGNVKKITNYKKICLSRELPICTKRPEFFSLADAKYIFKIQKFSKNYVEGISLNTFWLDPKKGLNIPFGIYNDAKQKKVYDSFLKKINAINYDAVGLSYVQNSSLVQKIKKKLNNKLVISKIENLQGVKNAEKICKFSDIIMIDRGDLAAEIGEEKIFDEIVKINFLCKKFNKPIILATENLTSMMSSSQPSKGEVISLAFAKHIGIDVIMLSEETAVSSKSIKITSWLYNFLNRNEKNIKIKKKENFISDFVKSLNPESDILVLFTRKGYLFDLVGKINSKIKCYIFTDDIKTLMLSSFKNNFTVFSINNEKKLSLDLIKKYLEKRKNEIFYPKNKNIYLIYAGFNRKKARANTIVKLNVNELF